MENSGSNKRLQKRYYADIKGESKREEMPQIEMVKIDDLVPYKNNSRTHSTAQVGQITASIKAFGFTNPVLIDADNGIIAGHGRMVAAKSLNMETVPCVRLSHLTPAQQKAYVIADNRLALDAGWDFDVLAAEIDALNDEGFDLDLLGFTQEELNELIGTPIVGSIDMPELRDGDREPFQQMAFTLHDSQKEIIDQALAKAKAQGLDTSVNENSNGNALFAIAEAFIA